MRKVIGMTAAAVLVLIFLYIGSTHRDRCLKAGNVGCTILPWSGHPAPSGYVLPGGNPWKP